MTFNILYFIFRIKDDEEHTYNGDKNVDDIVNFAIRMSGPPVQHVTRSESLANIKNMNQLFFMYVGDREGPLWETFYDIASNMQAHAYYYSASPDIAKQQVEIHTLPAVFVHKEKSHYFYSVKYNRIGGGWHLKLLSMMAFWYVNWVEHGEHLSHK